MQSVYIVTSQPNQPQNNSNPSYPTQTLYPVQSYTIGQSSPPVNNPYGYPVQIQHQQQVQYQQQMNNNYTIQNQNQSGHWRDGLCDCFTNIFPSCAMSFFFQCVVLGQISENINFAPCGIVCCGYVGLWILFLILSAYLAGFQWALWISIAFLIWALRNHLRSTQRISGNPLEDCFVSFFCQGCAVAQMARHLFQYREVCDEISCSNDGRPSYFNQINQNQNQTPAWQVQRPNPPNQIYIQPQQPQYATAYTSQYVQPQTSEASPPITKSGWQDNIGGASTPYNPQNHGAVSPSQITITASPAPQYPTIVVAQPVQQLTHVPSRYQEEDPPV